MNGEELLRQLTAYCDLLRTQLQQQTSLLADFSKRLEQIIQQLRKNIEVRDVNFADQFNDYVKTLRETLDKNEPIWTQLRNQLRQLPDKSWSGDLVLAAKGLNSRAKGLAQAADEFAAQYDVFGKQYKNFTAFKLQVWVLTSCQADIAGLSAKILFLAREIARKTSDNREAL